MSTSIRKFKRGRPPAGEDPQVSARMTLRLDAETKAALDRLVAREPDDVRGNPSIVIRRLIRAADAQIESWKNSPTE